MTGGTLDPTDEARSEIVAEIRHDGPMPFARYMELCLYHPRWGYYTRGAGGGGGRDYLTSSGIHRVFGAMVERQAAEMWRRLGRPARFDFVEFGPGEGQFALDVMDAARGDAAFAAALRYILVERSPALAGRQAARLASGGARASWRSLQELERAGRLEGCLFANEVLDAFPVHRVIGTPHGPREIHVGASPGGELEEVPLPLSEPALREFLDESGVRLESGQEVDLNLEAGRFVARAVRLLSRGYLVLVDYGSEARDLYHPARRRGTLRAFHRHRVGEEFLLRPGDQDLTAHLDFTALRRAAQAAGARCLGLTTQARFLLALGALDCLEDLEEILVADVPVAGVTGAPRQPARTVERLLEREAVKEVVLPDRMGDRFHVMIFGIGDPPGDLTGLAEPWAVQSVTRPGSPARA